MLRIHISDAKGMKNAAMVTSKYSQIEMGKIASSRFALATAYF